MVQNKVFLSINFLDTVIDRQVKLFGQPVLWVISLIWMKPRLSWWWRALLRCCMTLVLMKWFFTYVFRAIVILHAPLFWFCAWCAGFQPVVMVTKLYFISLTECSLLLVHCCVCFRIALMMFPQIIKDVLFKLFPIEKDVSKVQRVVFVLRLSFRCLLCAATKVDSFILLIPRLTVQSVRPSWISRWPNCFNRR